VPRFLSPAWIAAFGEAVAGVAVPGPSGDAGLAVRDGTFATGVIARDPSGVVHGVTLRVSGHRISLTGGASPDAAVTVRVGWDDAIDLMGGAWVPAPALRTGRAQVRGDLAVLRATGVALQAVQPHLTALSADTDYDRRGHDTSQGRE